MPRSGKQCAGAVADRPRQPGDHRDPGKRCRHDRECRQQRRAAGERANIEDHQRRHRQPEPDDAGHPLEEHRMNDAAPPERIARRQHRARDVAAGRPEQEGAKEAAHIGHGQRRAKAAFAAQRLEDLLPAHAEQGDLHEAEQRRCHQPLRRLAVQPVHQRRAVDMAADQQDEPDRYAEFQDEGQVPHAGEPPHHRAQRIARPRRRYGVGHIALHGDGARWRRCVTPRSYRVEITNL